jgi:hypothetical protein
MGKSQNSCELPPTSVTAGSVLPMTTQGKILISSTTTPATTITFPFSSLPYTEFEIFANYTISGSSSAQIPSLLASSNNGTSTISAGYQSGGVYTTVSGPTTPVVFGSSAQLMLAQFPSALTTVILRIHIYGIGTNNLLVRSRGIGFSSPIVGSSACSYATGNLLYTAPINGLRITMSSGTVSANKVILFATNA